MLVDGLSPATATRLPWRDWLGKHFASYITAPFAERHARFWEWISDLEPGVKPPARVEVWPRGGGKSATVELGCAYLGASGEPRRRFVLYVSETQAQADKHVQSIANMLLRAGAQPAKNRLGASQGWRREQVRTASGFNVAAFGLDSGMRGARLDEFRPDLIVFDDIDGRHDTAATVRKKIDIITETVLPAGSTDCAVIIVQNKIHADSIVSQLADGRADFLHGRIPAVVEPAVYGLEYRMERQPDGTPRYRITAGTASWAGQDLATCELQLNEWGKAAFLREAQHEVEHYEHGILKRHWLRFWQYPGQSLAPVELGGAAHPVLELPGYFDQQLQSWDLSFKQTTSGSYVAGLVAGTLGAQTYLLDRYRERTDFPGTVTAFLAMTERWPQATIRLVEDKANGPALMDTLRSRVPGIVAVSPDGTKEARMHAVAPYVEGGGLVLPHPAIAPWVTEFIDEIVTFPLAAHDDQADALSQLLRRVMAQTQGGYTMGEVLAAMVGGA